MSLLHLRLVVVVLVVLAVETDLSLENKGARKVGKKWREKELRVNVPIFVVFSNLLNL
jgi:hypothetical protein